MLDATLTRMIMLARERGEVGWYVAQERQYFVPTIDTGTETMQLEGLLWETAEECQSWIESRVAGVGMRP